MWLLLLSLSFCGQLLGVDCSCFVELWLFCDCKVPAVVCNRCGSCIESTFVALCVCVLCAQVVGDYARRLVRPSAATADGVDVTDMMLVRVLVSMG